MKFTFSWHVVDLPHEGLHYALFYAVNEAGTVRATCKVEPWGLGARPFLSGFCVDAEYRRSGIGSALLKRVMAEIAERGGTSLAMWVRRSNVDAQRFYQRLGFEPFFDDDENTFWARRFGADEFIDAPRELEVPL